LFTRGTTHLKNSSIKAEITDSKPKQVVDMDSMYSPISRPSSQGSTTDTAEEPPSISQHKLDHKKPSNIILYPTRPSNISVNNFVENVVILINEGMVLCEVGFTFDGL
jgi:hypothetical protein